MGHTRNILFCGQPPLITGEHFLSDISAQVTDLWSNTAGSLSTHGQTLTPLAVTAATTTILLITHQHGKHSTSHRGRRGTGTVMGFTRIFDRQTLGTKLFITEEEEVAIPPYD